MQLLTLALALSSAVHALPLLNSNEIFAQVEPVVSILTTTLKPRSDGGSLESLIPVGSTNANNEGPIPKILSLVPRKETAEEEDPELASFVNESGLTALGNTATNSVNELDSVLNAYHALTSPQTLTSSLRRRDFAANLTAGVEDLLAGVPGITAEDIDDLVPGIVALVERLLAGEGLKIKRDFLSELVAGLEDLLADVPGITAEDIDNLVPGLVALVQRGLEGEGL